MDRGKNKQNHRVPQWQLNKMMLLIIERWQEVWEIVEARDEDKNLKNRN